MLPDDVIDLANTFIELQKNIFAINSKNIHQTQAFLFDSDKEFVTKFVPQIAHYIYFASIIRQGQIEIYIELFKFLVSKADELNDLANICDYLLDYIFTPPPLSSEITIKNGPISFLRQLYIEEIISIDTIIDRIVKFMDKYPKLGNVYLLFFCWFIPEIERMKPDLYSKTISMFDSKQLLMFPHYFITFFKNLEEMRSNNWERFTFLTKYHYPPSSIEYYISVDDVASLQARMMNVEDVNAIRVECTLFETYHILQNKPTLVQFAIAHKAEKCAKFLLLTHARLEEHEYGRYPTYHIAIAVENTEFLHILEQERCNFCGALNVAAVYHRNNVVEWLDSTQMPSPNSDFENDPLLLSCVITENYSLILKCIEKGIDINTRDRTKKTALFEAARTNHQDLVEFLLTHPNINANIHAVLNFIIFRVQSIFSYEIYSTIICKMTPLNIACRNGYDGIVDVLLKNADIDVNKPNKKVFTFVSYI